MTKRTCDMNDSGGVTLIETLVYVAILSLVTIAVVSVTSQLIHFNARTAVTAQALDNANSAMAAMAYEIRHAESIYSPTSVFGSHPGQLSVETTRNVPDGEHVTYADFYVDDSRLYVKREEQAPEQLMSTDVTVTDLVFTYLDYDSEFPAVRIEMTVAPRSSQAVVDESAVTLSSTISLRAYE